MAKNLTLHYAAGQGAYWMSYCAAIGYASVFLTGRGFTNGYGKDDGTLKYLRE